LLAAAMRLHEQQSGEKRHDRRTALR
jgi:hypothetical protein